jgi:la-related protein 1
VSVDFITFSFGSDENLQNDHYLISLMDDQGWVPVSIIADFKRVHFLAILLLIIL